MQSVPEDISGIAQPVSQPVPVLVRWAMTRPRWVQELVAQVLECNDQLATERIRDVFALLEQEEIEGGQPPESSPSSLTFHVDGGIDSAVRLLEIKDLCGVNALAEKQSIVFHPKLTVIFGENGSGKSGYARVLKRAAAVRAAEEVLADIGKPAPAGGSQPSATFRLEVDTDEKEIVWRNELGLPPLTRVAVFDSKGAPQHVDPNLAYAYTPRELNYFPLVQHALDAIHALLQDELTRRSRTLSPTLPPACSGSRAHVALLGLGPDSDVAALEKLATISQAEADTLENYREEMNALAAASVETEIGLSASEERTLGRAREALEAIEAFDLVGYGSRLNVRDDAKQERARVAVNLAVPPGHTVADQPSWEALTCAAEEHLEALGRGTDYPRDSDVCIYCQQPLSPKAQDFLRTLRATALRATDRAVATSTDALDAQCATLKVEDSVRLLADARMLAAGSRAASRVMAGTLAALERALSIATSVANRESVSADGLAGELPPARESLRGEEVRLATLTTTLRTEQTERAARADELWAIIADIEARQLLAKLLPDVQSYVRDARWIRAGQVSRAKFQAHAKALTTAAKQASDTLLNTRFKERFAEECAALRAPAVHLTFPGRDGKVQREKRLGTNIQPSRVLSEGEQKSLALADFLAEVALKAPPGPVVFDDPVNSLDIRRIGYVAARVVALAEERQVIVFTHSIPFVAEILDRAEKPKGRFLYYEVELDGKRPGTVIQLESPRMDSTKALERTIRETIARAEAESPGVLRRVFVKKGYDHLRSLCEVVIEYEIFGNIVRRFRRNVMPGRLSQLPFPVLEEVCTDVDEIFAKVCGITDAHSQPDDVIGVQYSIEDLKADFAALNGARGKLKAKSVPAKGGGATAQPAAAAGPSE